MAQGEIRLLGSCVAWACFLPTCMKHVSWHEVWDRVLLLSAAWAKHDRGRLLSTVSGLAEAAW